MYIILVRHGEAEPETDKVSNRSRRLTDKGRRQVKKSAELLKKLLGNQPLTGGPGKLQKYWFLNWPEQKACR